MKYIFSKKIQMGLWLAILVFVLLASGCTHKCNAQWGLVDTVWCGSKLGGEGNMYPSPNDSMYIRGYAVWSSLNYSEVYIIDQKNNENIPVFISDSTIFIHKFIQNQSKFDSIIVVNFRTKNRTNIFSSAQLQIDYLHSQNIRNSYPYSKYDNCVYGFGNEDASGRTNKTRKLNLETGEITEVTFLNGLAGGSISQDGELVAGYYFQDYVKDGKILYDQYFKVYSLKTGETIISLQKLTTGREYIDIFPEFIFSRDHHYPNVFSFGISHIWDLSSKIKIKQIQRISLGSGKSINFTKVIFTKDSKGIFTLMSSMRNSNDEIMLDSTGYIIYDLSTLKEYRYIYPYGISFGGTPQAFVFGDNYLLTDGAVSFDGDYIRLHQNNLGNSSLLKLNFDVNSIEIKEQSYNGILYPNPATDFITVDLGNYTLKGVVEQEGIEIYNIFGERVLSVETGLRPVSTRIDISSLPPGMYSFKMGNESPQKFMVVR